MSLLDTVTQASTLSDPIKGQIQRMGLSRILSKEECGATGAFQCLVDVSSTSECIVGIKVSHACAPNPIRAKGLFPIRKSSRWRSTTGLNSPVIRYRTVCISSELLWPFQLSSTQTEVTMFVVTAQWAERKAILIAVSETPVDVPC